MFSSPDIVSNIIPYLDTKSILVLLCVIRDKAIIDKLYNIQASFHIDMGFGMNATKTFNASAMA